MEQNRAHIVWTNPVWTRENLVRKKIRIRVLTLHINSMSRTCSPAPVPSGKPVFSTSAVVTTKPIYIYI